MSEPTIDEVAAKILAEMRERNIPVVSFAEEKQRIAREAIRAFVERVEQKWRTDGETAYAFRTYLMSELAAMEKANE